MEEKSFFEPLVSLFKESVKRVPALKFLYGIIASIFIVYLINFLKLGDFFEILKGVVVILGLAFLTFLFSMLTNIKEKVIRYMVYGILMIFSACICGYVVMMTYFLITGNSNKLTNLFNITETSKPYFYSNLEIDSHYGHSTDAHYNELFKQNISEFNFFLNQSLKNDLSLLAFKSSFDYKNKGNLDIRAVNTIVLKSSQFEESNDSLAIDYYSVVEEDSTEKFRAKFQGKKKANLILGDLKIEMLKRDTLYYYWNIPVTLKK